MDEDLGPCCACETTVAVHNVLMLHKRGPTPGKGWGCFQCGLPAEGAIAVLCDACMGPTGTDVRARLRFACRGYPALDGRVPIDELGGESFDHDRTRHPEEAIRAN